jgi:hypothetical protein
VLSELQVQHLYEELRLEAAAVLEALVEQSATALFSNVKVSTLFP